MENFAKYDYVNIMQSLLMLLQVIQNSNQCTLKG